jgi:hypothetical protein
MSAASRVDRSVGNGAIKWRIVARGGWFEKKEINILNHNSLSKKINKSKYHNKFDFFLSF